MKLNVEKALKVCGNNNIYQKILYIAVALSWFSVDFVAISFPLLELEPNFQCKKEGIFSACDLKDACKLPSSERIIEIEYKNILTDFNLYCETTLVILIGVLYTTGILIGSIISSHFSDVLGRKPVLLICQVLFGLAAISMTFAPNMYYVLCSLFITGFASAGGTMVSFLYIYEVLNPNKRSLYGTLINFSFALAGMIYFTCFKYFKNWVYIAYICISADFIAFLLVSLYFLESPRFLVSKGQYDKALRVLYKIAMKNGKSRDFYRYILSDMLYRNDIKGKHHRTNEENNEYFKNPNNLTLTNPNQNNFSYNENEKLTNNLNSNIKEYNSNNSSNNCITNSYPKNSFLKNIKINSNSIIDNNLNNPDLNEEKCYLPKKISSEKTNKHYVTSSESSNKFSVIDEKNKIDDNDRRDSIDGNSMDIEEFIRKIHIQEESETTSDIDKEKKNEPLLISSKSTNFTESKSPAEEKKKEKGFIALFKYRSLRYKFLICSLFWFVTSFTYYGMSMILKKDNKNVFSNGYIIYLAEGISYFVTGIIMSISFLGRVRSMSIMMILTSIANISYYYLENSPGELDKIALFIGRFSITSIYSIMYTYSTEVYPTSIRAKGLGLNTFFARISSISVPVIIELVDSPSIIFSIMTFFSFFFTFLLPETNNKELEDEILEEKIVSKKISIDTN